MSTDLPKIIAVVGPTASGKTALGVKIAQKFGGEIISIDSMQIYKGMDIGTAKEKELPVPQHLIDILEPGEKVTVTWFQNQAYTVIDSLLQRGVLPVLVGCSMMYGEAVINGYQFPAEYPGRRAVMEGANGGVNSPLAQLPRYRVLKLGVDRGREELAIRVAQRTADWARNGLQEEIQALLKNGVSPQWLDHCGQEYRYFTRYLQGKITEKEAIEETNRSIAAYNKRQRTWWRRHSDLLWVKDFQEAELYVEKFLTDAQ
jgi:tRNA dimethylallyltransferase